MPVYRYRCAECGYEFEKQQRFSDDPLRVCPQCEAISLKKLIQPAGIVFKGSGWYITDSRSGSTAAVPAVDAKKAEAKDAKTADATSKTAEGEAAAAPAPVASETSSSSTPTKSSTPPAGSA